MVDQVAPVGGVAPPVQVWVLEAKLLALQETSKHLSATRTGVIS